MNFDQTAYDLDENFIADLIIRDQKKLNKDLNVNEINFDIDDFIIDFDLLIRDQNKSDQNFYHNETGMDSTYYHPHQTNVKQHEFIKYVQHSIPEELKKLILETNQDRGVKFINDNQIIVDTHIFNMKTKVQNKQGGRFVKWACAKEGCRFSLVTVEGRIKSHSRLQTLKNRKHTHSIKNDTIEIDIPILNNIDNQNTKQLLNNICNNLKSSMIWRPWL